jgi:hypothetical protein
MGSALVGRQFWLTYGGKQPQAEQHTSSTEDCPDLWRCPKLSKLRTTTAIT